MSDTSILPTADVGAPPAAPVDPGFGEEPTDDRRRLMIIGGAIAVVLVVIVGYLLLKGGSSDSDDLGGAVPRGTPPAAASSPEASGKPNAGNEHKAGSLLPKKSHRGIARDPFKPLLSDQVAAPVSGETTDVAPTDGGEPGSAPTTPDNGGAPSASFGQPVAIRLLSVSGVKSALFSVTYSRHKTLRYSVAAPSAGSLQGTVFAGVFSLLGVQGGSVTVQFGDDTPFDLKRGVSRSV